MTTHEPLNSSTTASACDAKRCSTCGQSKPLTDFAFRSKALGTRQSRCRTCQSEYNRAHHAANKKSVNPQVHARTRSHKADLIAAADALRHTEACGTCGRDRAAGADIILVPPAELTGGRRLSEVIRNGWALDRFRELLTATVADPDGVRCRTCLGRELGLGRLATTTD